MAKAEWGTKRVCPACGARYYDMKKKEPKCPSCGAAYDPEALLKSRRKAAAAEDRRREAAPEVDEENLDLAPVEGDTEEAVIEDAAE
ncbi:MAG: TIGR02300 family protein, partial [Alphaproteobacteria bacterium]|nr:TIGR02300 family protein [Alphaproteobacteria bacterium]